MTLDAQLTVDATFDDDALITQGQPEQAPSEPDSLSAFVDPSRSLEAARRMEANCRSGLRFFSDFRRVRPLDSFTQEDEESFDGSDEAFELGDTDSRRGLRFDPMFARR